MYAVKVKLKLNNKEQTLMRKHCGFSRFVYNYGLVLMQGLERDGIKGGCGKKLKAIKKVLTNYSDVPSAAVTGQRGLLMP